MSHFQPPSCSSGSRRKGRSLDFGFPAQKRNFFKGEGSHLAAHASIGNMFMKVVAEPPQRARAVRGALSERFFGRLWPW